MDRLLVVNASTITVNADARNILRKSARQPRSWPGSGLTSSSPKLLNSQKEPSTIFRSRPGSGLTSSSPQVPKSSLVRRIKFYSKNQSRQTKLNQIKSNQIRHSTLQGVAPPATAPPGAGSDGASSTLILPRLLGISLLIVSM